MEYIEPVGKNFSGNSNKNRNKSDFYQTPRLLVEDIVEVLDIKNNHTVLEPCCGSGAIVDVIRQKHNNVNIVSFDLERDGIDFLNNNVRPKVDWIITNPPFRLAGEFLTKALDICDNVVFLLPLSYLHGKFRYDTFYKNNYAKLKYVYVYTRYPLLTDVRQDALYSTGMMVYAWYVFDKTMSEGEEPTIRWFDNNDDIISKGSRRANND